LFVAEFEVTEKPIDISDFEEVIDSKTGAKILKLKADVAKRAGMMELHNLKLTSMLKLENRQFELNNQIKIQMSNSKLLLMHQENRHFEWYKKYLKLVISH